MTKKLFAKGNIIVTTPEEGYYGVAIVLDDAIPLELSPGRFSYPMNHILITPLLFTKPVSMDDINIQDLKPLVFTQYFSKNGKRIFIIGIILIINGIIKNFFLIWTYNKAKEQIILSTISDEVGRTQVIIQGNDFEFVSDENIDIVLNYKFLKEAINVFNDKIQQISC